MAVEDVRILPCHIESVLPLGLSDFEHTPYLRCVYTHLPGYARTRCHPQNRR